MNPDDTSTTDDEDPEAIESDEPVDGSGLIFLDEVSPLPAWMTLGHTTAGSGSTVAPPSLGRLDPKGDFLPGNLAGSGSVDVNTMVTGATRRSSGYFNLVTQSLSQLASVYGGEDDHLCSYCSEELPDHDTPTNPTSYTSKAIYLVTAHDTIVDLDDDAATLCEDCLDYLTQLARDYADVA